MSDTETLKRVFGLPELEWFFEIVRNRLERGGTLRGAVELSSIAPERREALARFFGMPELAYSSSRVQLAKLDESIRRSGLADGLEAVLIALRGPLANRSQERRDRRRAWESLFAEAGSLAPEDSSWTSWLASLQADGLLRRLSGDDLDAARHVVEQARAVKLRLPADGVLLAELAASTCGDSHALDEGRPLATICSKLVAVSSGLPADTDRRDLWAGAGVQCDDLSAPVLVLNLRASGGGTTARAMALHADAGEPYRISLRQLTKDSVTFDAAVCGRRVYVCENPSIVSAAADRLGAGSAPLVSIEGESRTAVRILLDRLAGAGIALYYHGDFDWKGIGIANRVFARHGARSWLFDKAAYEQSPRGLPLEGAPIVATWDEFLTPAMQMAGYAVHEEQVLKQLLATLAGAPGEIRTPA